MREVIAERVLLVSAPDKEKFETKIQIGKPYATEDRGWFCDLLMEGIEKPQYAAGADSLQAMLLTISLAESILINRARRGWNFYYPDTEELMEPSEYISWPEVIERGGN
jgi:hypothetical protein